MYIYIYIYIYVCVCVCVCVWFYIYIYIYGPGDLCSILSRIIPKTQKWYLMPTCLTLNIIRYGSRVKWSNPWKRVAPSPTPWCNNY